MTVTAPTLSDVQTVLGALVPTYQTRPPRYQTKMLEGLSAVWLSHHETLLDIGGGTGAMAHTMASLMPVGSITSIDVVDRFYTDLSVATKQYDGKTLPFGDDAFEAATFNNVIHHIPAQNRVSLMKEVARVVSGPVYIKDHVAETIVDHGALFALDAIGNLPFGGMVSAQYLSATQWEELAAQSGYRVGATVAGRYRSGLMKAFPNKLERVMRFDRVA